MADHCGIVDVYEACGSCYTTTGTKQKKDRLSEIQYISEGSGLNTTAYLHEIYTVLTTANIEMNSLAGKDNIVY